MPWRGAPCDDGSEMASSVGVLIVDDQEPFRSAARAVLSVTRGFEVVGEAGTGEDAVDLATALRPDLVLMDINMPGAGGIEATRRITAEHPGTVVVLVSTYAADDIPGDVEGCGAAAYVNKEDLAPAVLRNLWAAHGQATGETAGD